MTSKTIVLTGKEIRVEYSGGCNAWLRNDGTAAVYASGAPGISAGADGTVSIPAGKSAVIYGANGSVYLKGTGSVQLVGSDYSECPFYDSATSGGSSADEQARAALRDHEANTEIHVTAAEKSTWNGKADSADIPTKVSELTNDSGFINSPDGGNAAKVGGYSPTSIMKFVRDGNPTVDCNDCTESGWYFFNGCGGHSPINNSTIGMGGYFFLITWQYNPSYIMQAAMYVHGTAAWIGKTYTRCCNNGVWSDWDTLARSSDITHA